jgi:hypothetical protein
MLAQYAVIIRSQCIRHSYFMIFYIWFRFGGRFNFSDSYIFENKAIKLVYYIDF